MEKEILLQAIDMQKSFASTKAVDHVTLTVYKGEIHGLIGENGSGKSTITSMIAGYQPRDGGDILLDGTPFEPQSPMSASARGVSMILQEMGTIGRLTVAENLFMGNEGQFMVFGLIRNIRKMNAAAKELLEKYGLGYINPADDIADYSFEDRKMVELVKALYRNPKILVVDETTTALSQKGRDQLYALMKDVKKQNGCVIFISHDLEEVLEHCDSLTVFRDGHLITNLEVTTDVTEDQLKTLMVGRELGGRYYRNDYDGALSDDVVYKAESVNLEGALKDVSFTLKQGEILGIGGLTESGMHELGKVLFAAEKPDSGQIIHVKSGEEITDIKQAIDHRIGYVSKDRDQEALMVHSSIMDNISITSMDKFCKGLFLSLKGEAKFVNDNCGRLKIKMRSIRQSVSELSGGNKQKVALVKWISRESQILILDCPTRGIDVMVKAAIYDLMSELKSEGKSIIMISEEILELIGMCDRILVMKDGMINGELMRSCDLCEEQIIRHMV